MSGGHRYKPLYANGRWDTYRGPDRGLTAVGALASLSVVESATWVTSRVSQTAVTSSGR